MYDPTNNIIDERLKNLAFGPYRKVLTWPQYFTNGFWFHTHAHGSNKSTMNSAVCIKGKSWNENESDYYGILVDIIQLEYPNPTNKRTTLVLFKCDWFDATMDRGWKVHNRYGLVDINHKKRFLGYEPFVLAKQSQQVYFSKYLSKKKDKADWWAVCKIKARSIIHSPNVAYQEDEVSLACLPIVNDDLGCLCHENHEVEEHDIDEELAENEEPGHENIEESDFESSEDDEHEQSDGNIEYNDSEDDEDEEE